MLKEACRYVTLSFFYISIVLHVIYWISFYFEYGGDNQIINYCIQAEGVFRIAAENSEEEYVREQLNGGVVPEGVDVHCLAGLIKA